MKEAYALIATVFLVISYIPYIRDTRLHKTRPHPYTWFISGFLTFIVFGLQLSHGGGVGTIPTFIGAAAGILVFVLSLGPKRATITKSDTMFFILAMFAVGLWLVAKQPLLSAILVTLIDILAFIPTIRKSWRHPEQETVFFYFVSTARFVFSVIALQNYNAVAVLYPAASVVVNALTGVYLLARRKKLHR